MVERVDRGVEPDALFPLSERDVNARNINTHKHFQTDVVLLAVLARPLK
jgi:hypothetical protein